MNGTFVSSLPRLLRYSENMPDILYFIYGLILGMVVVFALGQIILAALR